MKKTSLLLLSLFSITLLACSNSSTSSSSISSSGSTTSESLELVKKDLKLNNMSVDYTLKYDSFPTYFKKDSLIPLVGVRDFFKYLDGFFNLEKYELKNELNNQNQTIKFYRETDENKTEYLIFDAKKDTIEISSFDFFKIVDDEVGVNYYRHRKLNKVIKVGPFTSYTVYLKNYNFDLIYKDNDIITNLSLLSTYCLHQHIGSLLYNQKELYFYSTYVDESIIKSQNKDLEETMMKEEQINERFNQLNFILDNFYGLRNLKFKPSFIDYLDQYPTLKNNLQSSDINVFMAALSNLIYKKLNDPHSSLGVKPLYAKKESLEDYYFPYTYELVGEKTQTSFDYYFKLLDLYDKTFSDKVNLRFENNTAFIKFDSFDLPYDQYLFNEDGTLKDDAYRYDTFYLFKKLFNIIASNQNIKNVVIDLTTNEGGEINACYGLLGFLSDEEFKVPYVDSPIGSGYIEFCQSDTDEDGSVEDQDAYSQYNYYLLTSNYTYSAANYFAKLCKYNNFATILGGKTGGGGCAVAETLLSDGSEIYYSDYVAMADMGIINNEEYVVGINDEGIDPDYELPFEKFYDLKYIDTFINSHF